MPLVSMRQLLDHAAEHSYGLPAFNVNNLEQVQAIMMAADEVGSHPSSCKHRQGRESMRGKHFCAT
jgi:fructose-bisphosphate aldolase, class II